MRRWTTSNLARPIDPSYRTNLLITLLSFAAAAIAGVFALLQQNDVLDSLVAAGRIALYVFLCWAITREIDPDHDGSAFLAVLLGLLGLMWIDTPPLLVSFWMIGILRVLNRTTGLPTTHLDTAVLVLASLWLSYTYDWSLAFLAGLTFYLDSRLEKPESRHRLFSLLLVLWGAALALGFDGSTLARGMTPEFWWLWILAALSTATLVRASTRIESVGDRSSEVLVPQRVQWTQIVLLLATSILLTRGEDGLTTSAVFLSAQIGAGSWQVGSRLRRVIQRSG